MSTSFTLNPPPAFEPAQGFDGFVRPADRASIVLRELPGPMAELTAGFEDEARAAQEGLELLGVEEVEVEGRSGKWFVFQRAGEPDPWRQWTLALGDGEHTALITAVVPTEVAERDEESLRQSLHGVRWRPGASDTASDLGSGLGFRIESSGLAHRRRVGEMVLLGDEDPMEHPDGAVAIGRSTSEGMRIVNRERFAVKRLYDQVYKVFGLKSHGPIEASGLHGFRSIAEVESLQDAYEDQRRLVAQAVFFAETDYFVIWVETDLEDERTLERFDRVIRSFVRIDEHGAPIRYEVPPPQEAAMVMDQAFELALKHPQEDAASLGERLARTITELDRQWASAYAAEVIFLRQSVETLAPVFDGPPGTPFHLETALRQRYPGYAEATYARAVAFAERQVTSA